MTTRISLFVVAMMVGALGVLVPLSAQASSSPTYYVSLGDSYSVGYQPNISNPHTGRATPGYTVYTASRIHMTLANFGCASATTTSIIQTIGCPDVLPNTARVHLYPKATQVAAAVAFITQHKGHIGLITVSIGGNDVTACASNSNPITCVGAATTSITDNVATLATDLRDAAGPGVPIIGLTYPDVILGAYVYPNSPGSAAAISLAGLSVIAFKDLINPALSKAYAQAQGEFVDVTSAEGSYVPLTDTVTVKKYGMIPMAVASVCALTYFCQYGNIHQKTPGYLLEGRLIVKEFRSIKG